LLSPEEARAFWYGLINYEQRPPAAGDFKLDRMRRLLARLGDPHRRLRLVHVAGSKGKGSTAAMLAAILRQAGHRTGLFTSPHLCAVEERFQVDAQPITAEELTTLLGEIHACLPDGRRDTGGPLTFFEVATAVGFLHFLRRRVDAAVLEVGLGGRLDSTNVCLPAVAIITSISYDHTAILGDRLAAIAAEKAGIVKPGRPAVSGATSPEARAVIADVCRQRRAPLRQVGDDFHYAYQPGRVTAEGVTCARVQVTTRRRRWPWLDLNLLGEHQAANAAVAVAVVEELREQGWHLPDDAVAAGLAGVRWPARMEVAGRRPLVVLDCAHNVASAEAVAETLTASFPPGRRWLVFGSSGDKDVAGMLRVLAPLFSHAFLTRCTSSPRALAPERLAETASASGLAATACPTSAEAYRAARANAEGGDLVCITGSVFLAGELRPLVLEDAPGAGVPPSGGLPGPKPPEGGTPAPAAPGMRFVPPG
jgi:dihydrofolate synthase/folylpolyglutamate synthase